MLAALVGVAARAEPGLPLESESFTVEVTGNLAEVVIHQRFRNVGTASVDATYTFPLHEQSVVDGLILTVGDRTIRSEVHDRDEALQIYADARAAGQVAALTEQERPNVFTQAVANLPPGVPIDVELHVVQPADRIDGEWQLTVPLGVAPRFDVRGEDAFDGGPARTDVRATLDAVVHPASPIRSVQSPSHAIDARIDVGGGLRVTVPPSPLDRDFVLRWRTAGDTAQAGLLVGGRTVELTLEAPVATAFADRVPRDLVWVLDTSCSMTGAPFGLVQQAMLKALATMDPRDSFSVLGFSDGVRSAFGAPVPANPENVAAAQAFVLALTPDGGTWMFHALTAAMALPRDPQRRRTIVFATDGLITADVDLLTHIAHQSGSTTFSTLGVGAAPNRYLLSEMASLGGGVAAYATLTDSGPDAMAGLVAAMDRPVLTGVTVDWGDCPVHGVAPATIPDLRPGRPVVVMAELDGACQGPVRVRAIGGAGAVTFEATPEPIPNDRALASTWARARVEDLQDQWMRSGPRDVVDQIRQLGLTYGIVTSQTSLVAVDSAVGGPIVTPVGVLSIPAGRSYQEAVATVPGMTCGGNPSMAGSASNEDTYMLDGADITDPVSGTFQLNFEELVPDHEIGTGRLPESSGFHPAGEARPTPDDNTRLAAEVRGGAMQGFGPAPSGSASLSGPLVRERLWLATAVNLDHVALGGLRSDETDLRGEILTQPSGHQRLWLAVAADPSAVELGPTSASYGGVDGRAEWSWFQAYNRRLRSTASGSERRFGADRATSGGFGERLTGEFESGSVGSHHLALGGDANRSAVTTPFRDVGVTWVDGFAQDEARFRRLRVSGGLRVDAVGGLVLPSPKAFGSVDLLGDGSTRLDLHYVRTTDPAGWLPPDLAEVQVSDAREVGMGIGRLLTRPLQLTLSATRSVEAFPFAIDRDLDPLPDHAVPSVERVVTEIAVGLVRAEARRWSGHATFTLTPAGGPVDRALLTDPIAPFVPGFLPGLRRYRVDVGLTWTLPADLELGLTGTWGSPIAGGPQWWLSDAVNVGARLAHDFSVRKGALSVGVSAAWVQDDIDASWVPLPALLLVPAAPSLDRQPPLRLGGSVGYRF